MATVTTGTQTTNEEMKPTIDELPHYIYSISGIISYKAVNIKGYKPNKFENVVIEYDYEYITECAKLVDEFKKNYPNVPI